MKQKIISSYRYDLFETDLENALSDGWLVHQIVSSGSVWMAVLIRINNE